jgi:eukaryotic-like serine/threonine-protein kinase
MRLAASPSRPDLPTSPAAEASPADACLTDAELCELADGTSGARSRDEIDQHLDRCEICLELAIAVLRGTHPERDGADERELRSLSVGTVLAGRYRIERFVSRGGMGEVYVVRDLALTRWLALKAVVATACDSPRAVGKLLREAALARRVAHPNVGRVFDIDVDEKPGHCPIHFFTMEYVEADALRARLESGPLEERHVLSVARQCLLALRAIHAAGVLHLDVKPENLLYREEHGEVIVTLIDFGLSRRLGSVTPSTRAGNTSFEGSTGYGAPEQADGRTLGVETDLYALGVLVFEMLTGRLPFVASGGRGSPREVITQPTRLDRRLCSGWDELTSRCLRADRQDRYPSADAMLTEVDQLSARGLLPASG